MNQRAIRISIFLTAALALGAPSAARANEDSPRAVVYGRSGSDVAKWRAWDGSAWSGETTVADIGGEPQWVVARDCPVREELLAAFLDDKLDLSVTAYDGSAWGSPAGLCNNTGNADQRPFDIAYESESGDALIVYRNGGSPKLRYRTWDGSSWSSQHVLSSSAAGPATFIRLVSHPSTDEILLLVLDDSRHITAQVWDGDAFGNEIELEGDAAYSGREEMDAAYEAQDGRCMVVWSQSGESRPRYRLWDGSAWLAEGSASDVGAHAGWVRLAADPASDGIIAMTLNGGGAIDLQAWDGSSWGSALAVEASAAATDRRCFDVAFEPDGTNAIAVWSRVGASAAMMRSWDGTAWSTAVTLPDLGGAAGVIQLSPSRSGREILAAALRASGNGLSAFRWDGSDWSAATELASDPGGSGSKGCFAIVDLCKRLLFTDVSVATGFDLQSVSSPSLGSVAPGGICWGDLDGDGDLDAIITGNESARVLLNQGGGTSFSTTLLGGGGASGQGALLDIDNDGDLDLWYAGGHLFENDGSGAFTDAGALGFADPAGVEGVAAGDIDGDGWCDVAAFATNGNWIGRNQGSDPLALAGTADASYGLDGAGDTGNGDFASTGDVNGDGRLDYFYHYDGGKLFLSNGDGTFTENASGIAVATGESEKMGSAWGDFDNDGDLDLFVSRYASGQRGTLWRQNSDGTFTDVTVAAGITETSAQKGCCWGDYDNDGDLDLYIVTSGGASNLLYQNQGDGTFRRVLVGAEAPGDGLDAVFVDVDNDGDLDLAVTQANSTNVLLRNNTDDDRYLKVRLIGRGAGRTDKAAIGVRASLYDATGTHLIGLRELGVARGYGGTEPLRLHFGGVDPDATYVLRVYFHSRPHDDPYEVTVVPRNASTTFGATTVPQLLTVEEPGISLIDWREVPNPDGG